MWLGPFLPTASSCGDLSLAPIVGKSTLGSWNIFMGHLPEETTQEKADLHSWMHTGTRVSWTNSSTSGQSQG